MNRLIIVVVLIVVAIAGLGFYLGWFNIASDSDGGKGHITLTVDKDKIQGDEKAVLGKVKELTSHATDKVEGTNEKSKD
jgi:hypothetical protein